MIPSIGRMVHYRLPEGAKRAGEWRPATIIRVNGDANDPNVTCNLHVLYDGPNDSDVEESEVEPVALSELNEEDFAALVVDPSWIGSVSQGEGLGQWREPPRVLPPGA